MRSISILLRIQIISKIFDIFSKLFPAKFGYAANGKGIIIPEFFCNLNISCIFEFGYLDAQIHCSCTCLFPDVSELGHFCSNKQGYYSQTQLRMKYGVKFFKPCHDQLCFLTYIRGTGIQ